MSTTCNRLHLQTLGPQPIVPKQSPQSMIGENRQLVTNEPVEFEK